MKREILVDSSTIISISNICLLDVFRFIKEKSDVKFLITPWIREEVVDNALKTKRFRLSGIRISKMIKEGILEEVGNSKIRNYAVNLLDQANSIYSVEKKPIKIFHKGEVELLAASQLLDIKSIMTDEKILRFLLESPEKLEDVMIHRMRRKVEYDKTKHTSFLKKIKSKYLIRSCELISYAFSKGFFDKYSDLFERSKAESLRGALWSLKLNGCATTRREIDQYVTMLIGR